MGFPTRLLEASYVKCLCELLSLFQSFILTSLKRKSLFNTRAFFDDFSASFRTLAKIENKKHLQPNFSDYLQDLNDYVKLMQGTASKVPEKYLFYESFHRSSVEPRRNNYEDKGQNRRLSVSSTNKYKEDKFRKESPKIVEKKKNVRQYQDEIMKSIIKELSGEM
jgi:hypothetical protein